MRVPCGWFLVRVDRDTHYTEGKEMILSDGNGDVNYYCDGGGNRDVHFWWKCLKQVQLAIRVKTERCTVCALAN